MANYTCLLHQERMKASGPARAKTDRASRILRVYVWRGDVGPNARHDKRRLAALRPASLFVSFLFVAFTEVSFDWLQISGSFFDKLIAKPFSFMRAFENSRFQDPAVDRCTPLGC